MSVTEEEIISQPDLWRRAVDDPAAPILAAPGERMLVIGCGTSAFMAMSFAELRERAGYGETDWAYGSEVPAGRRYGVVLALTRSGTTTEIVDALQTLTAPTKVVLSAVRGGPAASLADHEVVLDYADEASIVQTRFPTTAMTLLRSCVGGDPEPAIKDADAAIADGLPVDPAQYEHFVYLGTGWTVGLAHEAALKMREAAQAWSESYPAMDYRHGPIAVAGQRSLVTVLGAAPPGLVEQVGETGATVLVSDRDPLAQLVTAQRLAIGLAQARGLDPDRPRGLTRSVVLP